MISPRGREAGEAEGMGVSGMGSSLRGEMHLGLRSCPAPRALARPPNAATTPLPGLPRARFAGRRPKTCILPSQADHAPADLAYRVALAARPKDT
jgi:hypothetical protein